MKKSTSFDLKDAETLLKQLQQFSETLQQQWSKVSSQWSNLQGTWHDEQFDKFDPLFEKLSANYDQALLEFEHYIGFLKTKIQIAEQQGFNLLAERTKKKDQFSINTASLSTTSKPPTFAHSVTKFANSLNYPIKYGSFEVGKSGRIEATTPDGRYTDCYINFEVSGLGRVRIQDTVVAPNYQHKSVGTKLLEVLESNLPDGTVLYFSENQAPDFWKKMGFEATTNNGVIEYWKIVSHPGTTR